MPWPPKCYHNKLECFDGFGGVRGWERGGLGEGMSRMSPFGQVYRMLASTKGSCLATKVFIGNLFAMGGGKSS